MARNEIRWSLGNLCTVCKRLNPAEKVNCKRTTISESGELWMGRGGRNFLRWQQLISKQKDFAVIIYGAGPREQGNRSKSLRNLTTFDPSLLFVLGSVYGTGKLPLSGEFRRRENLCNPADNLTSHTYAGFAGNLTPPATASRRFRRTPPGTRTRTAGWNGRWWGGLMMEGGKFSD